MAHELPPLPIEVAVKRSDPVYNAHAYLTKVPYSAILPFIEGLTEPGDTVLDLFAGSGMTGVASVMAGRNAELRDISALGRHIGHNYWALADAEALQTAARAVADEARETDRRRLRDHVPRMWQAGDAFKDRLVVPVRVPLMLTSGHLLRGLQGRRLEEERDGVPLLWGAVQDTRRKPGR
jgi:hypothetical protein